MKSSHLFGALFLATVASVSVPTASVAQNAPEIYCNVATSTGDATPVGIYRFTPSADLTLEPVKVDDNIKGVNGAVYADGRYEIVRMMDHYTYDAETWDQIHSCKLGYPAFMEFSAMSVTYDPATAKSYGCYLTTSQSYRFAAVDYSTHEITGLRDLGADVYAKCMFVDDKGILYAIMNNGDLVTVSKTDGATSVIGNLDFETSGYSGAVYDPVSGVAYWTATVSGTPALYELDLSDASTTLVGEFPNGEETTGLFIKRKEAPKPVGATYIYGNVAASADGATPTGIYRFAPGADLTIESVKVDENIKGVNGAVYADGRYEIIRMMDHYTYDTETWDQIHSCKLGYPAFMEFSAMSVTYDPATAKSYGCYLTATQSYRFAAVDYGTHEMTGLRDLGADVYAKCMFVDDKGTLYAIMNNGDLVTVSKTDGTTAVIGNIDFEIGGYTGAVYNPASGMAYWTATVNGTPALYELDLSDASTTLVGEFPNGEEFCGLYMISESGSGNGIPAAAEEVILNFTGGDLEGTLAFTAPATDTEGNPLAGELTYTVKVDESEAATGTAQPGADVTTDLITIPAAGEHLFAVTFANATGSGKATYKRSYIGFDKPEPAADVKLAADGLKLTVSWTAPAKGLNDAWFDAGNLRYDVVRYPGEVKVAEKIAATEFSETLENVSIANYYYGVTVYNGTENSDVALSPKVKLGTYILPPYSQDFRNDDALDFYTIIDANGDGVTWGLSSWSPIAEYYSAATEFDADDWMVTPPVSLSKNNIYCISLVAMGSESDFYDQNIKVMMGSGKTAEKLDTELVRRTTVGSKPQTLKAIFTVEEDGIYYFGFHTSTPSHNGWVNMTDLSIMSVGTLDGPDVVKNLVVEPGEKGALEATITFTAPTADAKGNPLASIDKIELTRDGELIREWNNAVPGADLSHNDKALSTGMHSYEVTAYNQSGAGYPAVTKGYIGVDVPASVENLTLAVADGKATLSWVPAAKGLNGGYVDTSSLKYYVQRSDGAYVASGIDGTSITDIPEKTEHQYELAYAVAAVSAEGSSPLAISNVILFGDNYVLPFVESFNYGNTNYYWGLNNLRGGMFMLSNNFSVDNDGGSIAYHGSGTDSESEVTSGRIDISTASAPVLSFYAPLNSGEVTLSVRVITPDKQIHEVKEFKFNISGAYNPVSLGLAAYKNTDYVQIVLNAKSTIPGSSLFIDAITLDEDSGVGNVINDMNLAVTVNSPEVVIETAAGVNVAIYSASGVEVARFTATGHDTTTLGRGLYVVKAGTETRKFVVK